eukprot:1505096-Rhodomonas_salina.2
MATKLYSFPRTRGSASCSFPFRVAAMSVYWLGCDNVLDVRQRSPQGALNSTKTCASAIGRLAIDDRPDRATDLEQLWGDAGWSWKDVGAPELERGG